MFLWELPQRHEKVEISCGNTLDLPKQFRQLLTTCFVWTDKKITFDLSVVILILVQGRFEIFNTVFVLFKC